MMFRSFIYLNEELVSEYNSILKSNDKINKSEVTTQNKNIGGNKILYGGISKEIQTVSEFSNRPKYMYNEFEENLVIEKENYYFDFTMNDYDINTIPNMSIFKIQTNFNIPEEFENSKMINDFKGFFLDSKKFDKQEEEILENYLCKAELVYPIIFEIENIKIYGYLNQSNLQEDYADLEDYETQEVYILCRATNIINKEKVTIFDPWKNYIKLPRHLRRSIGTYRDPIFQNIEIKGPVMKVEIIAIYK